MGFLGRWRAAVRRRLARELAERTEALLWRLGSPGELQPPATSLRLVETENENGRRIEVFADGALVLAAAFRSQANGVAVRVVWEPTVYVTGSWERELKDALAQAERGEWAP